MDSDEKSRPISIRKKWAILAAILVIAIFPIGKALEKEITIQEGASKKKVIMLFGNVEAALKKANIALGEHDQVSKPLEASVKDKMLLKVKRAHPVKLQCDGKTKEIMTAYDRVKDILKEHKIVLGELDEVHPSLENKVFKNDIIQIMRIKEEIITQKEPVLYGSVIKHSDKLEHGKIKLIQKGQNGEKEVQYKLIYRDGEQISKEILQENILAEAVDEIVEQGTAKYVATSRGNFRASNVLIMTATAYDSSYASTGKNPGHPHYGLTKLGTRVRPGVVAVDPKVIPLRTKLYIESLDGTGDYGFATAEDTGGAIKGNKIDLYMKESGAAKKFGRRKVKVYVLE